jgi:hypothetical protein
MSEKILFLTGRLAERQLNRVLDSLQPADFMYKTQQIGISVAALMTPKLIRRRVPSRTVPTASSFPDAAAATSMN